MAAFPTRPDAMDAGWLAAALGAAAGSLSGFAATPVGTGQMCDSFRLTLDWAERPAGAPTSIIAKCPSLDPASRNIAERLGNYVLEVSWYRELADTITVPRPACHFADIADNGVDFLLLLEDLSPARQGDQLAGAGADALMLGVDAAARLHAPLWNSPRIDELAWLQRDSRELVRQLFPVLYAGFRERYTGRLDEACLALGADIVARLDRWLDRTPPVRTIIHGDLRLDNILFAPDLSACWVLDWQTLGIGSGASDIAYLIGTGVADADTRRGIDRPAFERWLAGLAAGGVSPDEEALWREYRLGALSGYFMAVFASMSVERTTRGDEMFAVMAERPARQAIDLESLSLL